MDAKLLVEDLVVILDRTEILHRIDLTVQAGEFFFLLGPSGCGKTTLLRTVAGFYRPVRGRIRLEGVDITELPPHRRRTPMVFQSYALWPHLSVFENVALGLRARRLPEAEVRRRVEEALRLVRLEGLGSRRPNQLSGGQQQRVALARALVVDPQVLLLDEPLSNLDAQLRLQMRQELKEVHRRLGLTAIYVTHDQDEALSMADRLAVMRDGRLEQVGSPEELYRKPANSFVATFLGEANLIPGRPLHRVFETPIGCFDLPASTPGPHVAVVRPEAIVVGQGPYQAVVMDAAYQGRSTRYRLQVEGLDLVAYSEVPLAIGSMVAFQVQREAVRVVPDVGRAGGVSPSQLPSATTGEGRGIGEGPAA